MRFCFILQYVFLNKNNIEQKLTYNNNKTKLSVSRGSRGICDVVKLAIRLWTSAKLYRVANPPRH